MLKYITLSVLTVFTQIIAIIMWGEYIWLYKVANGGVGGSPLGQIQPAFWWIIFIEAIILISLGISYKKRTNNNLLRYGEPYSVKWAVLLKKKWRRSF